MHLMLDYRPHCPTCEEPLCPNAIWFVQGMAFCHTCGVHARYACLDAQIVACRIHTSRIIRQYYGLTWYVPLNYGGQSYGEYLMDNDRELGERFLARYRPQMPDPSNFGDVDPLVLDSTGETTPTDLIC